jgi:nicotinate phosphoribosyltransferase
LDSGDLAYLSKECRRAFREVSDSCHVDFAALQIVASNDLSEKVLWSLREQGHEIDCFGVGTNLVSIHISLHLFMLVLLHHEVISLSLPLSNDVD